VCFVLCPACSVLLSSPCGGEKKYSYYSVSVRRPDDNPTLRLFFFFDPSFCPPRTGYLGGQPVRFPCFCSGMGLFRLLLLSSRLYPLCYFSKGHLGWFMVLCWLFPSLVWRSASHVLRPLSPFEKDCYLYLLTVSPLLLIICELRAAN